MKLISVLAGAAVAVAAFAGAALAQNQLGAPETRAFGDFTVRCFQVESGSPCDLYEQVRNRDTGQPLVNFSIAFLPANNRYVMVLSVPLGVSLEKGVIIQTNRGSTPVMPFRRCDRAGCYIEAAIDRPLVDFFSNATGQGKVLVTADGEEKPRELAISFNGFGGAHTYMVEQNRARAKGGAAAPAAPAAAPATP